MFDLNDLPLTLSTIKTKKICYNIKYNYEIEVLMKKIILIFVSMFLFSNVSAAELVRCIDGDTAVFIYEGKEEKVRFLAIDTPEYTTKKEAFGEEASDYTCNSLINAHEIELVLDPESDKYDKYDRLLAWVFVDDVLLQESLVEKGLADVKYIYGDYLYTNELKDALALAKQSKIGMWEGYSEDYNELIFVIIILILCYIVFNGSVKETKKVLKKLKLM